MKNRIVNELKKINTRIRKALGRSDIKRWRATSALYEDWDSRTEMMSTFISENTKIIEFGAGRLVLKDFIPESCEYTPSDIVDRGQGTIVLDLNKSPLPVFQNYDYAVFSGVLEYVNNVPELISHLSEYIDTFVLSYAVSDNYPTNRGIHGWVNSYSEEEIIAILEQNNYALSDKTIWRKQVIFVFRSRETQEEKV